MEFKFSVTGIPYIEFDQNTRLIFTKLSPDQKTYKWFSVVGGRQTVSMKRNGRVFKEVSERLDFITDATLSGFPRGLTKNTAFTRKHFTYIRKVFRKYMTEDGLIHEDKIPAIKRAISRFGVKKPRKPRKKKIIQPKELKKKKSTKSVEKKKKNKLSKICKSCDKEIFTVPSCNSQLLVGHGERWIPVVNKKVPCKHCGVFPGGRHHLYCPNEQCPRCKKKLFRCGCFY